MRDVSVILFILTWVKRKTSTTLLKPAISTPRNMVIELMMQRGETTETWIQIDLQKKFGKQHISLPFSLSPSSFGGTVCVKDEHLLAPLWKDITVQMREASSVIR